MTYDPKDELFDIPAYHVMEHVLNPAQDWTLSLELMVTHDLTVAGAFLQELVANNFNPTRMYSIEETVGAPVREHRNFDRFLGSSSTIIYDSSCIVGSALNVVDICSR